MFVSLKYLAAASALLLGAASAKAIDLPVKSIDGKDYYYYSLKTGDTLYSISELTGISTDDIKRTNPNVANGLSKGSLLLFAVDDFDNGIVRHTVKKNETVFGIANLYKVTPEALIEANPQAERGVRSGMVLTIPRGSYSATKLAVRPADSKPVADYTPADAPASAPAPLPLTHKVEAGETFSFIALKYGLSTDDLVDYNPFVDPHHMPVGTVLRLADDAPLVLQTPESRLREIRKSDITETAERLPSASSTSGSNSETAADAENRAAETAILVLQPFMTDDDAMTRPTQLVTDFYRGLILAADTLAGESGQHVTIVAADTKGDAANTLSIINDTMRSLADNESSLSAIIAPEDATQLDEICKIAAELGIYVFNPNNIKDETYLTNPYVIQANITQQDMYDKAIDAFMERYDGFIPVILDHEGDRNEKAHFVTALTDSFGQKGITPITINFSGSLSDDDLAGLNDTDRYVFIPMTGSLSTFKRFATALIKLRAAETGESRFALFGYPDWVTFRGDALENLHMLDATIYSRFFLDESSYEAKEVADAFTRWYGTEMLEMVPSQAILGYDTGLFLIRALRHNNGSLDNLENFRSFRGTQSTFRFDRVDDGGYVNKALYIINFKPAGQCSVDVL